jgi:hypothetical protein
VPTPARLVSPVTVGAAAWRCLPQFNMGVSHSANIRKHKDPALGWAVRTTAPPDNIHGRT